jgi:tRNA modification GTPase
VKRLASRIRRHPNDTIVAPATAPGRGSIAVIRISGPDTFRILDQAFGPARPSRQPSHTVRLYALPGSRGRLLDQVMLAVFRAPRSYTGEHMAEISCHGGTVAPARIVARLGSLGCRPARPGEFTRRAVLAGKLTLSQAEALPDLIAADSPAAFDAAFARYQGGLDRFARRLAGSLTDLLADLEHAINFDEDAPPPRIARAVSRTAAALRHELRRARQNRYLHQGVRVAIVGRPNVGKSSLFNRLVGSARAIASPLPHTTRDRVEATVMLGSIPVRLTDTAGLVAGPRRGIGRLADAQTRRAVEDADLLLALFDASGRFGPHDRAVTAATEGRATVTVLNKWDIRDPKAWPAAARVLRSTFGIRHPASNRAFAISCHTGAGIARLEREVRRLVAPVSGDAVASGERQLTALQACLEALERSRSAPTCETAALEIRSAVDMLTQIDPRFPADNVLDRIFSRFCVGK